MTPSPYERPVTRSVSALLTGSSRQPLNGFIGVPHSHVELDGLALRCRIRYSAPNICSSVAMVAISPGERSRMRNGASSALNFDRDFASSR
jgi:hypothetical protein